MHQARLGPIWHMHFLQTDRRPTTSLSEFGSSALILRPLWLLIPEVPDGLEQSQIEVCLYTDDTVI